LSDTSIFDYISNQKHSEEAVLDILDKLKLSASIDNLESGIHTPIVNHDIPLSSGDIVRWEMERVLIDPTSRIIVEELTEYLDARTEGFVMDHLYELKKTICYYRRHPQKTTIKYCRCTLCHGRRTIKAR